MSGDVSKIVGRQCIVSWCESGLNPQNEVVGAIGRIVFNDTFEGVIENKRFLTYVMIRQA